jgi:membrane-bound serine protease (ClpP class)
MCLIYPSGAHAGSAGAIIMQACHVSGAMEATNIGAATPITSTGANMPEDLRKKIMNDTRSWVEGLAKLRGRSESFARDIVDQAKAVDAKEALKLNAIDAVVTKKEDFLQFSVGRKVKMSENLTTQIQTGETITFDQDLRYQVMNILMSPEVSYLIFMGSLGLLYFELTHPGMIAPGVIGAVGLIISMISMEMLEVVWGAVLLMFVGIALMLTEAFVPGFGILGVGGIVSFFIGSLFLFDPEQTGYVLPLSIILPTVLTAGLLMLSIAYLAFSTRKRKSHAGSDEFIGRVIKVEWVSPDDTTIGDVFIDGEIWKVSAKTGLKKGDLVKIMDRKGLTLQVQQVKGE